MIRKGDWEQALMRHVSACERTPFAYGEHDCTMFAAGAVLAMTGHDPMAEFRGRYRSMASSVRALREIGAGTLEATLDGKFPQRPIAFARRGDLALHDGSVGVVMGATALFVGEEDGAAGLVRVDRVAWQKVWAVG